MSCKTSKHTSRFPSTATAAAVAVLVFVLVVMIDSATATTSAQPTESRAQLHHQQQRQFFTDPKSRETDPPNFVRLVVMRLIYGLAVQMGMEDRLSGVLNGIFVPPNADDADDDYGGGFGDDLGDFDGAGDLFDF